MSKKNILFINGIPDNHTVKVRKIKKDGGVSWGGSGSANISNYLKNDLFDLSTVTFDTNRDQKLPRKMIHAVFNEISDPDSHKIALKKADDFYKAVSGNLPFFNAPSNIMKTTRDNIYQLLQGINKLHVPKTVRIQPKSPSNIYEIIEKENFNFPVIFRQAGDHGGISTMLIKDTTEEFFAFPLDGRDYYLTQFVDCMEDDLYSKYRLVVVDGEVFIRGRIMSTQWLVHFGNRISDENAEAIEADILERFETETKPIIQTTIREICKILNLDYFGMDCHINEGMNILVFEINANMNILTFKKKKTQAPYIKKIHQALIKMIKNRI